MHYGPEGKQGRRYKAPTTFTTKKAARQWLSTVQADIIRGKWLPPEDDAQPAPGTKALTLATYANTWLEQRDLKPRTHEHYRKLLDGHILRPPLGNLPIALITADDVRSWYAKTAKGTPTLRAHCYSLLRTIMNDAVRDRKASANPCVIRGAGSAKRAVVIRPATIDELAKLVEVIPERYKAMVLLASWCALRFGELTELRRNDIDIEEGVVRVRRGVVRTKAAGFTVDTPKSVASVRDVNIPSTLLPALRHHLVNHVGPGNSLLFTAVGDPDKHLQPSTLTRHFYKARAAAGRPDLAFHHLRHSGSVLASAAGASLAENMQRLGHSTPAAAMRYAHAAQGADRKIADALAKLVGDTPDQ
ncbi:tyrosine recombinase XerC [Mycobacterium sp. M23085]|uniref:site-specific integrase n=1 Tax=Mycobacterium sp. M23085 TaxID=3378087 RepID=UPI003877A713